jgi:hypothetical protein
MKKILLPNNNFGGCIMLLLMFLVFTVPFTLTAWLVLRVAPWYVAGPSALLVAMVVFLAVVKFKE